MGRRCWGRLMSGGILSRFGRPEIAALKRSRADDGELVRPDAAGEGRVGLLLRDRRDLRRELVQVADPETVIDRGVQRVGDTGVGAEVDLEAADPRALLLRQ